MSGFLLDTNVLSELTKSNRNPKVAAWVEATDETLLYVSVLTLGEIRKGIAALAAGMRRAELEAWLETDLRARFAGRVLPIDETVADRWGWIAGQAMGQGTPIPVIDGLLAATALQHNFTLVTRNIAHVVASHVETFNPWEA